MSLADRQGDSYGNGAELYGDIKLDQERPRGFSPIAVGSRRTLSSSAIGHGHHSAGHRGAEQAVLLVSMDSSTTS
jgi:hypothetical protein